MRDQHSATFAPEQVPFTEKFYECDDSENVFGSFELEKVIVCTRMLGRQWGAQVLCVVEQKACFNCPSCDELLTHVRIGNLSYDAEVEARHAGEMLLANLIAEHNCLPDDLNDEVATQ